MIDYLHFVTQEKSMLIAPAGFGKTHTIAECLKKTKDKGKQLVLTHTHAGVASIKEKIKKEGIPYSNYEVETITSFAQRFVLAFYIGDIPKQEKPKEYYPFIIKKATELFKLKPIRQIILNTYNGLFVDEYQDCTKKQHELILLLSELFPTRILGDPLQGIFGFNGDQLVDMTNSTEMGEFSLSKYELDKPQRWLNGNNASLGSDLKTIRTILMAKEEINLKKYSSIEFHVCTDLFREKYNIVLQLFEKGKSILIIDPVSTNVQSRIKFIQQFKNIPRLLESIDEKEFYLLSNTADLISSDSVLNSLYNLSSILFNESVIKKWFLENSFVKKKSAEDKVLTQPLQSIVAALEKNISFSSISMFLKEVKMLPDIKCYRHELLSVFCKALEDADHSNISVYEAMVNKRNLTRRLGRKIFGNYIGTTLLTKGLEFETVVVINAHKFDCPKHLYVALTRACKRLIVFTNNPILNPYK